MTEHFFWQSQLQTPLRPICAHLLTQLIFRNKVLGITITLGLNTRVEGGRKSGGTVFEVDPSKKSVQF